MLTLPHPRSPLAADDDNDAVLFEKIKSGNYDADDPIWDNVSDGAKDLVEKLLTVDAEKRLTAEEALSHPWVQGKYFEDEQQGGKGEAGRTWCVCVCGVWWRHGARRCT
jgi:serine/threonine protein kinase